MSVVKDKSVYAASKTASQHPSGETASRAHHRVFREFPCWQGRVPQGFIVNFLGVMTRVSYFEPYSEIESEYPPDRHVETQHPEFDEEYFEWIDLLEAVTAAQGRFTMLELGAGFGRWTVNAAAALKQSSGLPYSMVAVEAEPTHFQWMVQHLSDNSMDLSNSQLIQAVVAPVDGKVGFDITSPKGGGPSQWYGQCIGGSDLVDTVSLDTLLQSFQTVDLIDLDVQGAESAVLNAAAEQLDQKVKRVHIGTHGPGVETALHSLFNRLGWECIRSYPAASSATTEWGEISFRDGVQSWMNPTYSDRSRTDVDVLGRKLEASRREGARMWQEIEKLRRERETWRIMNPSSLGWRVLAKAGSLRDRIAPAGTRRRRLIEFITDKI
jgi:FkbM family methyltransferase